jgi:hypothetical protein
LSCQKEKKRCKKKNVIVCPPRGKKKKRRLRVIKEIIRETSKPPIVKVTTPTVVGPPGPQGSVGATGETGQRGPAGETGQRGPAGETGQRGSAGGTGSRGPAGEAGEAGPRGPAGPQGPSGIQGPPGPVIIPNIIIIPNNQRYFYSTTSDIQTLVVIPANQFTNDNGAVTSTFGDLGLTSYNNLYINGILQESSLYSVTESALTINLINQTIYSDTPIILEIVRFSAQIN